MHPIERLRYVARAGAVPIGPLVGESAAALSSFAAEPGALLTACRRLLDRRPHSAPLVWLAARMLTGPDPRAAAWAAVGELERDPTVGELEFALREGSRLVVVGDPEIVAQALDSRPDVKVVAPDSPPDEIDLVILESECIGPTDAIAPRGTRAAVTAARDEQIPVWLVGGVGRRLPARMWDGVVERIDRAGTWTGDHELVPLPLIDVVVTPLGPTAPDEVMRHADCPITPELFGGR